MKHLINKATTNLPTTTMTLNRQTLTALLILLPAILLFGKTAILFFALVEGYRILFTQIAKVIDQIPTQLPALRPSELSLG